MVAAGSDECLCLNGRVQLIPVQDAVACEFYGNATSCSTGIYAKPAIRVTVTGNTIEVWVYEETWQSGNFPGAGNRLMARFRSTVNPCEQGVEYELARISQAAPGPSGKCDYQATRLWVSIHSAACVLARTRCTCCRCCEVPGRLRFDLALPSDAFRGPSDPTQPGNLQCLENGPATWPSGVAFRNYLKVDYSAIGVFDVLTSFEDYSDPLGQPRLWCEYITTINGQPLVGGNYTVRGHAILGPVPVEVGRFEGPQGGPYTVVPTWNGTQDVIAYAMVTNQQSGCQVRLLMGLYNPQQVPDPATFVFGSEIAFPGAICGVDLGLRVHWDIPQGVNEGGDCIQTLSVVDFEETSGCINGGAVGACAPITGTVEMLDSVFID